MTEVRASDAMIRSLHEFLLTSPPATDGYALPSVIAREYGRSLATVTVALRRGVELGLFEARDHATQRNPTNGAPVLEYRATVA